MANRTKYLALAAFVTVLDTAVASRYGLASWSASAGIIWARLLLILLFAMMIMSLLSVWYRAGYESLRLHQECSPKVANVVEGIPRILGGESDV